MVSKFATILIASACALSAFASPVTGGSCNSGDAQCCNQVMNSSDPGYSSVLGLLGVGLGDITGQIGAGCTPITAVGLGTGANCNSQAVCCTNNNFNGVVALGCSPINFGL
ncbi:hypothetical protein AMATHDRAFT_9303 [Amanita thiersii Skay4041]|uniref:Hydrophobin n=1 Tax=Amanita thiersii Skay4041 TaxID=703135 RepID=A0A2A9N7G7_9AGAR|nr:hypothetical protein AMATHDRAFT_9303 [Amanita thiersii Skay4041]